MNFGGSAFPNEETVKSECRNPNNLQEVIAYDLQPLDISTGGKPRPPAGTLVAFVRTLRMHSGNSRHSAHCTNISFCYC
jgi:hypothetical protein